MRSTGRLVQQAVLILLSVSCACILFTAYAGDDIINHNTWPNLGFRGAMSFANELTGAWFLEQGRFFPVALFLMAGVFWLLQDLFVYKLFLLLLLALQIALQRRWLAELRLAISRRDSAVVLACSGCGIWSGPIPSVFPSFKETLIMPFSSSEQSHSHQ